jgi:hypothetical protein
LNDYQQTLRMFMTCAPATPPDWFKPIMPCERPADSYRALNTDVVFSSLADARAAGFCRDDLADMSHDKQMEWDRQYQIERLIQWPMAWAKKQWSVFYEQSGMADDDREAQPLSSEYMALHNHSTAMQQLIPGGWGNALNPSSAGMSQFERFRGRLTAGSGRS